MCRFSEAEPFPLPPGTKEQLTKENEEWKQKSSSLEEQKTELEVRMSALKSQYEGRICRLERELREQQERHHEQRDEPPESTNKVQKILSGSPGTAARPPVPSLDSGATVPCSWKYRLASGRVQSLI